MLINLIFAQASVMNICPRGVYPSMHWGRLIPLRSVTPQAYIQPSIQGRHPPSPADGYCSARYVSWLEWSLVGILDLIKWNCHTQDISKIDVHLARGRLSRVHQARAVSNSASYRLAGLDGLWQVEFLLNRFHINLVVRVKFISE